MSGTTRKYRGFLLTEMIVGSGIIGMLLACMALTLYGLAKVNRYQLVRQRCIAAAESQLDSITATGRQIAEKDLKRLWPGLNVSVKQTPGIDEWKGLTLAEVTAVGESYGKQVTVRLSRYILTDRHAVGDAPLEKEI
ncbi:MAG: hypothetical protein JW720_06840 [Sedimentisphaerales bacterium]|nr:hypothetical protein [Sedimentisphaerales bacterium]